MTGLQAITLGGLGALIIIIALIAYRKPIIKLGDTDISRNSPGDVEVKHLKPTPEPILTHEELEKALNAIACSRNIYWRVFCTAFYEGDPEKYQALATVGKPFNIYIEDGAPAYWSVYGDFQTADEAAHALLKALGSPPNHAPKHKDERKRAKYPDWEGAPLSCTPRP